jgi:hypothetical protein
MTQSPYITRSAVGQGVSARVIPDGPAVIVNEAAAFSLDHNRTIVTASSGEPRPMRLSRLKTVLDKARKAGAASVTTPEGYTYTLGQPASEAELTTTADDELARWRRKHAR